MLTTIIPIYLKKVIQQTNDELQKTRDYYNFEIRLHKQTKVSELLNVYSPDGLLVNK
jgi:hypothetical protein